MPDGTVALPERLGRRLSIGPFQDPRDLLRFLLFAAAGGLVALLVGAWAWLPFLLAGLVLTLPRVEEESLGVVVLRWVRFQVRARSRKGGPSRASPGRTGRLHLEETHLCDTLGRTWECWEATPFPISGRGPAELLQSATHLLQALGSQGGEWGLYRLPEPWCIGAYLPPFDPALAPRELALRRAYGELLREAVRGKHQVRLVLALAAPQGTAQAAQLEALGWARMRGGALRRAVGALFPLHTSPGEAR